MKVFSLGGIVGPALFLIVVAVLATRRPDYNHVVQFISELGASGTPHAFVMNYLGFVPTGVLIIAFGVALVRTQSRRTIGLLGSMLVILFGFGVAISGVVSCDPGCPQGTGSIENMVHNIIAPISFVSLIIGIAILGYQFRRLPLLRALSTYSFVTSALALLFFLTMVGSLEERTTTGLWQRLLLATLFLWCAVTAARIYRSRSD